MGGLYFVLSLNFVNTLCPTYRHRWLERKNLLWSQKEQVLVLVSGKLAYRLIGVAELS